MRVPPPRRLAVAVVLALALAGAGCGGDDPRGGPSTVTPPAGTPTAPVDDAAFDDATLIAAAGIHAEGELGVRRATRKPATLLRSTRDPRWAIVSGAVDGALWVVWMRDGKVELATTDVKRFNPPAVPCDVRPAFSEPIC